MKKEIEVIGFDDAPFNKKDKKCILISVYMRGNRIIDNIYFSEFEKDGLDVTNKIIKVVKDKHYPKIKVIFLYGITFGGFNIADIHKIYEETKKPTVVVIDKKPNFEKIFKALKHFKDFEERKSLIEKAPAPEYMDGIYVQYLGIDRERLKRIVDICRLKSKVPECLRVAHLIGRGFLYLKKERE
ncbi:protein of unknown function DUF99 [Methanocaldococcus infernus ME]|uniref:UPF0215 protein Metin_0170 n=1 Tax=Methanocaldococcus infernus (strain DSM 11812 / JCM 15783 / ME) TaxID=573063 RepID=D5VQI9_METIM|nr:DUF99 family protein [Methanocaldococcus infernus]ADG12842.1 protein of unknown function DUF99 [Methanocaldococcus infernus ME]